MIVSRRLAPRLLEAAGYYPVVTVTGPRQSGKTTLCRAVFADRPYVSLEPLDNRAYARDDPRGFLDEYRTGAVIDEVQHAPGLVSYLQEEVDRDARPGRFVLTGSQHFGLGGAVAQSLAGRTAVLHLLPLGLDELRRFPDPPRTLLDTLWMGGYPRIHDQHIPPERWLADYVAAYLERDVRQVVNVGDLTAFGNFLRLAAGRTAQLLNLSALGADAGVSHNTARAWLSVLEASFVCFRLPAWHRNVNKRLVKAPKLHFFDTGLAAHLLGIQHPDQLAHHPLRGALFETWVVAEAYKARAHDGLVPGLHHYREARGAELDLVLETGGRWVLAEAKSGATVATESIQSLARFADSLARSDDARPVEARLIHGGDTRQQRGGVAVLPWFQMPGLDWSG